MEDFKLNARILSLVAFFPLLFMATGWAKLNPQDYRNNIGPQPCAECHEDETSIWKNTHHFTSYKKMPRSKEGREIAKKMGVRRIKTSENCATCHFSLIVKNKTRLRPVSGVSCESCHGPAKEWNDIHHDYGGEHVKRDQETKAHQTKRIASAIANGMLHPSKPYRLFKQCYGCHMVADEALVNKTDHPVGDEFDLVAWSNGEIRHNVFFNKGKKNPIKSEPILRRRFILGNALTIEYGLKALSQSKTAGKYKQTLIKRIEKAKLNLQQIQKLVPLNEVAAMLETVKTLSLENATPAALNKAADTIQKQTKLFLTQQTIETAKTWKRIDPLLPKKNKGNPKL